MVTPPFKDIRDPGVTQTYHGLSLRFHASILSPLNLPFRALTSLSTASPAFVDSPMVMVMLMLIPDADADADADAVAGLMKVLSNFQVRCDKLQ